MPGLFRRLPRLQPYFAACASVAFASGVRWLLAPWMASRYPYLLQFLAVLFCARYLGLGPAVVALLLGTSPLLLGMEFVDRPPISTGPRFWVSMAVIYGVSLLLIWMLDRQRRMTAKVAESARLAGERLEQLEIEIAQRERIQRHSAQLRAIVESSEDAIISKTLDGFIQSWNHGAEQIYGYTAPEVL